MSMKPERPVTIGDLSPDEIHEVLAARFRRYTLYCLYLQGPQMSLRDVAEQIVEWESDEPLPDVSEEPMRTYSVLYHSHLPKLVDTDVVSVSGSDDVLEVSENAAQLRPYLEWAIETDLAGDYVSIR